MYLEICVSQKTDTKRSCCVQRQHQQQQHLNLRFFSEKK